jgi:hypothetical protein
MRLSGSYSTPASPEIKGCSQVGFVLTEVIPKPAPLPAGRGSRVDRRQNGFATGVSDETRLLENALLR